MATRTLLFTPKQLQKKFKHAADFGIKGNYNPANANLFQQAIKLHVRNPATKMITGSYRGKTVTHFYNPSTGLNVVKDVKGYFVSGWKLNHSQIWHLINTGKLGGG